MKSVPFYLTILLLFISLKSSAPGYNDCVMAPISETEVSFTVRVSGCQGSTCMASVAEAALINELIEKFKGNCLKEATLKCAKNSCPPNQNCQAFIVTFPALSHSWCTIDTAGKCNCKVVIKGTFGCSCADNEVHIVPSNTTGNYCPADYLTLTAVPDTPMPNIDFIQWFVNDSVIDGANSLTHVVTRTGRYEVLVVDTDSFVFLSDPFQVRCPGSVPTLQEWGLIIFGIILLAVGVIFIIKRRKHTLGLNS